MRLPLVIDLHPEQGEAVVRFDGRSCTLEQGEYSAWQRFSFKAVPGVKVHGIGRFLIKQLAPDFEMYLTPVNIDPEHPAMPIAHPMIYSVYLSKLIGPYATLGEAEDTWALNEGVISDTHFIQQCYDIYEERAKMFFHALEKTRQGVCVCVFDTSDRLQHMFWRPQGLGGEDKYRGVIEGLYRKMDILLGDLLDRLGENDILFILSDHGISPFERCFNLNTWLLHNGYLALRDDPEEGGDFFANVDWTNTRAYGVGMSGLFINKVGREAHGIVRPGEDSDRLKSELQSRLRGLRDEEKDAVAILEVYDTADIYQGPYRENGPDLVIGCNKGYRIGWESVVGKQSLAIFDDNRKRWSADHCVDSRLVPGVLFCNRPMVMSDPEIVDLAPTILRLFGVEPPPHMDGKALEVNL
jgi:predicted AlkP superfamily phosphohydrolase/phosphomutase